MDQLKALQDEIYTIPMRLGNQGHSKAILNIMFSAL
jgi:hypothetical protein